MWRKSNGQSMVEMAFVLPILMLLLFAIIEFSWYIFGYATVTQAARNGAEIASQLPPFQTWLAYRTSPPTWGAEENFRSDHCVNTVMAAIESDATLFAGDITNNVEISYPQDAVQGRDTRNLTDRGPIAIRVIYRIEPLTPLYELVSIIGLSGLGDFSDGTLIIEATSQRSLENLGLNPDFAASGGVACARDLNDYRRIEAANNN